MATFAGAGALTSRLGRAEKSEICNALPEGANSPSTIAIMRGRPDQLGDFWNVSVNRAPPSGALPAAMVPPKDVMMP